jgi:hypothetical protein
MPLDFEIYEFELFDANRYRVIFYRNLREQDANLSNERFKKSLCPHLQYRKKQSRIYKIK